MTQLIPASFNCTGLFIGVSFANFPHKSIDEIGYLISPVNAPDSLKYAFCAAT